MLLSILLVADQGNTHGAKAAERALRSQFGATQAWKDQYEILHIGFSDKDLAQSSGTVSVINALVVKQDGFARCQGKYVWILPSFIGLGETADSFSSLRDVLALGLDAVTLCPIPDGARHNEWVKSPLDLLPTAQQFEEYRYILPRAAMLECFAQTSDFDTSLVYLLCQAGRVPAPMYAKIPCELIVVMGVASHPLLSMSLSYFSGACPWQREVLRLPYGLVARFVHGGEPMRLSPGEIDSLRHFMFSGCSALEFFSKAMFNEKAVGMEKKEAFVIAAKIVDYFVQLTDALKITHELITSIAKLRFFLEQWMLVAASPIASENVSDPEAKRGIFDGVWWLDRDLKEDFNRIGAEKLVDLLNSMRHQIQGFMLIENKLGYLK